MALGKRVREALENYPAELLAEPLEWDLVIVLDDVAKNQLLLKQYSAAEITYQKTLSILLDSKNINIGLTQLDFSSLPSSAW